MHPEYIPNCALRNLIVELQIPELELSPLIWALNFLRAGVTGCNYSAWVL